ncbi:MAG TPA: histidine phosphatase family protein, partial [Phenylobacterium sp.]|nr:histidine phosphatase family protein [Phenylobacterium sp.]
MAGADHTAWIHPMVTPDQSCPYGLKALALALLKRKGFQVTDCWLEDRAGVLMIAGALTWIAAPVALFIGGLDAGHVIPHPEVEIDAAVPVPRWRLSDLGVARMRRFVASAAVEQVEAVWASTETKAIEAAGLLAACHGLPVQVRPDLGEN